MNNFNQHGEIKKLFGRKKKGNFSASVIYVDVIGFTKLVQKYTPEEKDGVIKLLKNLHGIFSPMIETVFQTGGFVPHISGDAFVAIFPDKNGKVSEKKIRQLIIGFHLFAERQNIRVKAGFSAGMISWGKLENENTDYFFRGSPLEESIKNSSLFENSRYDKPDEIYINSINSDDIPEYCETLQENICVFISFKDLQKQKDICKFTNAIVERMKKYDGFVKEIDFSTGDGVVVGFFSFDKDCIKTRVIDLILFLKKESKNLRRKTGFRYKIGMTSGKFFSGKITGNHPDYQIILSMEMILTARLMQNANWGEILVDESINNKLSYFFNIKGKLSFKGLNNSQNIYSQILYR